MEIFNIAFVRTRNTARPSPNLRSCKSLNFQEKNASVENVEVEKAETVESVEGKRLGNRVTR
jgi:hypothetical protein